MNSTLDLATAETRVLEVLMDAAAEVWTNDQIDNALRAALEEYSRASLDRGSPVRARMVIDTVTPADGARECDLSDLDVPLLRLDRVWFPYDAAVSSVAPVWIPVELWWNDGAPSMFMLNAVGDGAMDARIFYAGAHALKDLDSADDTTFDSGSDNLICLGAAGFACRMRSIDLNETTANQAVSTPNYAALADIFLGDFREQLLPRKLAVSKPFANSRPRLVVYDTNTLSVRVVE